MIGKLFVSNWLMLFATASLFSLALPASAEDEGASQAAEVARLNEAGADFYARREYRKAIEKFIQAYAIDADPNLLFNIARCYELLGEAEAAMEKYQLFLDSPGADARGRKRARDAMNALRESRAQANREPAPPPVPEAKQGQADGSAVVAVDDGGSDESWVAWAFLGGGAVLAGAGATLYLLGASDHGQITDAEGFGEEGAVVQMTRREAEDLVDSGDRKKLMGVVGMGVGGALLTTYVIWALSDSSSPPRRGSALAFGVEKTSSATMLSIQGSF